MLLNVDACIIIYILKRALLLLIVLPALVFTTKAQVGYNYHQYSLGFGVSNNSATTDIPADKAYPAAHLNFSYNLTPYTAFTLEYEFGKLSSNSSVAYLKAVSTLKPSDPLYATQVLALKADLDPYSRYYTNQYQSINLHVDVQFGEFINYDNDAFGMFIRNVYVGAGIGMVYNNTTDRAKYNADTTYAYGGADKSNNVMVPLRVGYQFKFNNAYGEPSVLAEIGYQRNFVFGYGLDGYSDPLFTTRQYETFGGFRFGVKINFGNVTSYRKPIH